MLPGRCRLTRASSERHLAEYLEETTAAGTDLSTTREKIRLLDFKSTTVGYLNGGRVHHRILQTGSNAVHPCASSVSLGFIRHQSTSPPETTTAAVVAATDPNCYGRRKKRWWRNGVGFSQDSGGAASSAFHDESSRRPAALGPPPFVLLTSSSAAAVAAVERLRINVSGQCFETHLFVLERHPDTLLGNREKRKQFFDRAKNEVFFDRHRPSFEAIFAYYQCGGRLKRPHHVPDDVFLDELVFYQLEREAVEEYKRTEGYAPETVHMPSHSVLRRIWMLFEYPETSRAAFLVAVISVCMTLVSIVLFCVETLPMFAKTHCVADEAPNFLDPFFMIETTCTAWFTLEAIVRFVSCPRKACFWRDFKNLVDVTAIVPYYITLFNVLSTMSCEGAKSSASLAFLRVIRLIRVFKLTKHSVGLQVLVLTFQASVEGLGLFLVALCVCLLVFSSAIYYAELGVEGSQIHSIPDAFWWAIITMTTVGYGDKVPVGYWGKLVGSACAITGVLTLAIPVPIITGHFNRFYSHKTGRGRHV